MIELNATEIHALLALGTGPSYGYRLQQRIEEESGGSISPDIGALYRTLGRLMDRGWVDEVDAPKAAPEVTRGRPRRYYGLTSSGRRVLAEEIRRLEAVVDLAHARRMTSEEVG